MENYKYTTYRGHRIYTHRSVAKCFAIVNLKFDNQGDLVEFFVGTARSVIEAKRIIDAKSDYVALDIVNMLKKMVARGFTAGESMQKILESELVQREQEARAKRNRK